VVLDVLDVSAPLDVAASEVEPDDDVPETGVQHCSLAGPGQRPGVEM